MATPIDLESYIADLAMVTDSAQLLVEVNQSGVFMTIVSENRRCQVLVTGNFVTMSPVITSEGEKT